MRKLLETLETIQPSALNLCSEKETDDLYGDPLSHSGVSVRGHSVLTKIGLPKLLVGEIGLRDCGRLWTPPPPPHRYVRF